MWNIYLIVLLFLNNDGYSCKCNGENVLLKNINRNYELKTEWQDHGFIKDMYFDSIGVLTITCLLETHFPTMNMNKNPLLKADSSEKKFSYKGVLGNYSDYIWREDVLRGYLSITYVVKENYEEEFDAIIDSVSISN